MFILGVGAAHPDVELSDQFLASIGLTPTEQEAQVLARSGVHSRRVPLPLEYIQQTKNADVLEGRAVATISPTALGVAAARQAIERAGISVEQIGLLLGDTATPYQTCPSEAQRVAGALGLKIPAYDVIGGVSSLPLYVEMLSSWKPERVPEYVLCVSTNTPSQHVAYSGSALPAYLYGDAAAAMVISPRHAGKFKVVDSYIERRGFLKPSSEVGRHVSFAAEALLPADEIVALLRQGLSRDTAKGGYSAVAAPQLYGGDFPSYEKALGLAHDSLISGIASSGYSLGASYGVALSSVWSSTRSGDQVALLHAGDGMVSGSILLASE